jgi:hypothetical protein
VKHRESFGQPKSAVKFGFHVQHEESPPRFKGEVFIDLRDLNGNPLHYEHVDNLVVLDGGILLAILMAAGVTGSSGLTMLGVGTGATGPVLNPDVPDPRQRHLNAEIARKPFASVTFRTSLGAVSAVPTNIVDFTTTFGNGEAVGPLNEMSLMRTISMNPLVTNPVPAVFPVYDPTIDMTLFDDMVNYLTFGTITKPSASVLTITWRLTF